MNLFGKKKKSINPSESIQKLRETLDVMQKREEFLDKQISTLTNQARTFVRSKKRTQAIFLIKKRKLLEKQLDNLLNIKMNIEVQIIALAQAISNTEIVNSMKVGKETLTEIKKQVNSDAVADVMDDLGEALADVDEVTDIMAQPIAGTVMDDEELLKELDEEFLDYDLNELPSTKILPIPKKDNKEKERENEKEQKELKELEMMMSS